MKERGKMNIFQFRLLITNIFIGLSFLADGIDRLCLIGLGILWAMSMFRTKFEQ